MKLTMKQLAPDTFQCKQTKKIWNYQQIQTLRAGGFEVELIF